ncbi:MAG TPA: hypothetical protein VF066_09580 [Thermoleophilaceae bacterium]
MLARIISVLVPPLCVACGADAGRAAPLCRECRARMRQSHTSMAPWAAFDYDGPAGALVRALKFGGRAGIADLMAAHIAALAPPELLRGSIVPVPVHPRHRRQRGIDHGQALARSLARRTGLPCVCCLARGGDPLPQVGRGRRARMQGPTGTVTVGTPPPSEVLLIDDVVTTGATLAACITALRDSGCDRITPIVYARTTGR